MAIARAIANDPPILLADEPTGNLDTTTGQHIIDLLVTMRRAHGRTLVLVTHDAGLADMADEIMLMRDGRLVERRERAA